MVASLKNRRSATEAGFTLVELLVVVVILGILSAVVVFAVRGSDDKGKAAASATDERILRTAQEAFCATYGRYAQNMGELVSGPPEIPGAKGFLSEPSKTHTIRPAQGAEPKPCNGTGYIIGPPGAVTPGCTIEDAFCLVTPDPPAVGHMVQLTTGPNAGKVFLEGSVGQPNGGSFTASALYDPQGPGLGTWTLGPPAPMSSLDDMPSFVSSKPVELTDPADLPGNQCGTNCGKLLVPLSIPVSGGTPWQLVDPASFPTLTWQNAGPPPPAGDCCERAAVPLKNGKVLIHKGTKPFMLYDPAVADTTQSFTIIPGDQPDSAQEPAMVPLNDPAGRVLVVGTDRFYEPLVQLYDPASNTFSPRTAFEPEMDPVENYNLRMYRRGDVVLLPDGRVLALSGYRADIYDVANDRWSRASTCAPAPSLVPGTPRPVCKILGVAGDKLLAYSPSGSGNDGRAWLFDPAKPNDQAWTKTAGAINDPNSTGYAMFVKGTCTNCNRLLTVGPFNPSSGERLRAELYKPKLGSTPTPTTTTLLPTVSTIPVP